MMFHTLGNLREPYLLYLPAVGAGDSNPAVPTIFSWGSLGTWITAYSEDMGNTFQARGFPPQALLG